MSRRRERVLVLCLNCKSQFETIPNIVKRGYGKFCGWPCMNEYRNRPQLERRCTKCKKVKTAENFDKNPEARTRLRAWCLDCRKNYQREYNRIHKNGKVLDNRLRNQFGISLDDYRRLLAKQRNRCAICRSDEPGNGFERFLVDHDHETGLVRGLLCVSCNSGLGHFRDSVKLIEAAGRYLNDPPANRVLEVRDGCHQRHDGVPATGVREAVLEQQRNGRPGDGRRR